MENDQKSNLNNPGNMAGPDRGRQGNDKAPGEEPREGKVENVVMDTQKAKDKPEGDPPIEERDHPGDV
jgi:hypothetical protein